MTRRSSSDLLGFYRGEGRDSAGRAFKEVLALGFEDLERSHDYIQWLFPLLTPSDFAPEAPVLDPSVITEFRRDPALRAQVLRALRRMLEFYGLELDDEAPDAVAISEGEHFKQRSALWLTPANHNYRRLTRMLTSLQLLGFQAYAEALFECLQFLYRERAGRIGEAAFAHWRRASRR